MDDRRKSNDVTCDEAFSFSRKLNRHGIELMRAQTHTLQVNVGLLCNQTCRHCHLSAGPAKTEIMSKETADQVADWARRARFKAIDITGGAPELNPHIEYIVSTFSEISPKLIFRSNLTALHDARTERLMEMLSSVGAVIVASFPSVNESQSESQRGNGIFQVSIEQLRKLNLFGYGKPGSGLELNLVSNPTGAFLASDQRQSEKRFKQVLGNKWGVEFNDLLNFSNVPLGRFRRWLEGTGNLVPYMKKLSDAFNPSSLEGVMCRTLVSVSWDGYLYDCDFNLARGLPMSNQRVHASEMHGLPSPGSPIATADHCFSCTAGTGFT